MYQNRKELCLVNLLIHSYLDPLNNLKHIKCYGRVVIDKGSLLLKEKEAYPISLTYLVYMDKNYFCLFTITSFVNYSIILRPNEIDGDGVHEAEGGDNGQ